LEENILVMESAIAPECLQLFTRKLRAQTAVKDTSFVRTGSDLTFRAARMNVELIRPASLARESFDAASAPGSLLLEAIIGVEGSPVVVTGAAIQTAGCQQWICFFYHCSLL